MWAGNSFGRNCEFKCSYGRPVDRACNTPIFCLPDPYGCTCNTGFHTLDCGDGELWIIHTRDRFNGRLFKYGAYVEDLGKCRGMLALRTYFNWLLLSYKNKIQTLKLTQIFNIHIPPGLDNLSLILIDFCSIAENFTGE